MISSVLKHCRYLERSCWLWQTPERREWPHPNKSLTHCPATNSNWHFRDTQALIWKINTDSYELLWLKLLSLIFFAETAKLIMATRVPTVMENLEISENLHWNISINYSVSFMCSFACWGSMIIKFHHKRMQLTFPIWVRFISELSVKNDFNYSSWF